MISAGRLAFSRVPRLRTVSMWSMDFRLVSRFAISLLSKSSVMIIEKPPLPNSFSKTCWPLTVSRSSGK